VPQGSVLGPEKFIAYSEDLECLIDRHSLGHHFYADDGVRTSDICLSIARLQQCVEEIHRWCASRLLQLNPSKTEVIWFGTTGTLKKIRDFDLTLRLSSDVIEPVDVVRDLGVLQGGQ
jgi:Reverse transcriptase (RNA-dependent DNA polymerase)